MEELGTHDPQRYFERDAIRGLASHFRSLGLLVAELGHPEDDPEHLINVDAKFQIGNILWAVEHSRIVYDPQGVPAETAAEKYLRPRLSEIAKLHGIHLRAAFYAPRWNGKKLPRAEWDAIVKLAQKAASEKGWAADERGNSVVATAGTPSVDFTFFASDNPYLAAQYEKALRSPLNSKLSGQLRLAKNDGYSVLLLLDQYPAPAADPGTMWMPDAGTLNFVARQLIDEQPGIVDEIWLREGSGNYRRVIGTSLDFPEIGSAATAEIPSGNS